MTTTPLKNPTLFPDDPKGEASLRQRAAANPEKPVWVGASAGSGKTKVLVDRMLRLMLPGTNHLPCDPGRILCITFTKAAAAEVMERVAKRLRAWAVSDDATLDQSLQDLLNTAPTDDQRAQARSLFAKVLDTPGGMKIMTIHSFCQSVLARFPMEAGLPAGFEVMEDGTARALMRDVRRNLIVQLMTEGKGDKKLKDAFAFLSALQGIDAIERLMEKLSSERGRLNVMMDRMGDIDAVCDAVDTQLGIAPGDNEQTLIAQFFDAIPANDLQILISGIDGTTKTNTDAAATLRHMLDNGPVFNDYILVFLTTKFTPRKPSKAINENADLARIYLAECDRCMDAMQKLSALYTSECTKSLLRFGITALDDYEAEKQRRNVSDFEDLIAHTKQLLSGDGVHWVQYKLDGGIDHILVDEAQDTNPDQWDIISSLYGEFYAGLSTRGELTRTTFVVGDEKQSIYSFQRADPRIFEQQRQQLDIQTANADNKQERIALNASFRSGPSILRFVDTVFAPDAMMNGVVRNPETDPIVHVAAKSGMTSRVEIWPIIKDECKRTKDNVPGDWDAHWTVPAASVQALADRMAQTMRGWLDRKEILESQGRPIEPGDILILLVKRNPMAEPILRALRKYNIPVTGIDRMVLNEQIAVQDSLAALSFALTPDDDLTLATLLKSPFINLAESDLLALSYDRRRTPLWDILRKSPAHKDIAGWLSALLERSGADSATGFLHHLFYTPCPANGHSGMTALLTQLGSDAIDPLQELLARADRHAMTSNDGLQGFLHAALNDDSQIKRQMDATSNRVRLMTVHGAKGLEAPIVFLPDTLRTNAQRRKVDVLQWPPRDAHAQNDIPLWAPDSARRAPEHTAMIETAIERADEEYRRLLYVALTRPAERLYITAAQTCSDGGVDDHSWYHACRDAFNAMDYVHDADDKIRFITNAQTDAVDNKRKDTGPAADAGDIPDWARASAPAPEFPPRPLMPSRPDGEEPAAMSPLDGTDTARFKRGTLIHTLFQFIPELPVSDRRARAADWLARPAHKLSDAQQDEILNAVMSVLDDATFAPLFGPQARVEVPITGMLAANIISGQIDRLLVDDTTVTILDYKTNRPAPKTPDAVSATYKTQLRLYRDLLKKIYPNKDIRAALLWTDGPSLMDMTLDL